MFTTSMINSRTFVSDVFNIHTDNNTKDTQLTSKKHHACFRNILIKYKFTEIDNKVSFKDAFKLKDKTFLNSTYKDGIYFVEEPYGSQNSPDFVLMTIFDNKIITFLKMELKCGEGKIMWNDGYPKPDTQCIYSDHKFKQTIVINGSNLMSHKAFSKLEKILQTIKSLNEEVKDDDLRACNFRVYVRKANSQKIDLSDYNAIDLMNFKKYLKIKMDNFIYGFTVMKQIMKQNVNIKDEPQPNTYTAISLFSGAGGDTLGMSMSGVNVVGFVEYDDDAIKTHLANFPKSKLIGKDICGIEDSVFEGYKDRIDIIFGGFPCQSFSHGGKKKANDPRGQLYKQFVRATKIIKPKFILGENVKGILTRKNSEGGLFKDDIIREFNTIGYGMCYKVLSCEKFGVPQTRKRVFFVGIRNDLKIDPTSIKLPVTNNNKTTLRDICTFSLKNALKIEKKKFLDIIPENKCIVQNDGNGEEKVSGTPPTNLKKCYNEEKKHGLSFKTRGKGTYSGIEDIDSQAHTILCAYNRMPRLFIPMKFNGDVYLRPFTIKELQQIQGFPKNYLFHGKDTSVIKQIGNAVPPIVVCEVVKYLLTL